MTSAAVVGAYFTGSAAAKMMIQNKGRIREFTSLLKSEPIGRSMAQYSKEFTAGLNGIQGSLRLKDGRGVPGHWEDGKFIPSH